MAEFDPAELLRVLSSHRVEFVVIGGVAAQILGSPMLTADLDICYGRSDENLARLAAALVDLGATLRGADANVPFLLDAETLRRGDSFTFATSAGPLDCLGTPAGTDGYDSLRRDADLYDIAGSQCRVVSLESLMEMKRASGRPKDRIAIENLAALKEELEAEP